MQPADIARAIQGLNYSAPTDPRSLLAPQPATLSQAQPTNRQRLAAAIIGDSAPGSLRRQIAAGLVGDGSEGRSTGLLDYTPAMLGFMDESARKAMTPGQRVPGILELAAGLIPGAAEGVGGLAKSAEKTGLAKVAEDMAKPTAPIIAYHGSPQTFDAFGASKIGTGEGVVPQAASAVISDVRYPMASPDRWYGSSNFADHGGSIVQMTPDEYLSRTRPLHIDDIARDNIDDLKNHIQRGGELDPPAIYADGKEDGRHRAQAAKELGIDQIPVLMFTTPDRAQAAPAGGLQALIQNLPPKLPQ